MDNNVRKMYVFYGSQTGHCEGHAKIVRDFFTSEGSGFQVVMLPCNKAVPGVDPTVGVNINEVSLALFITSTQLNGGIKTILYFHNKNNVFMLRCPYCKHTMRYRTQ